ncbi:MAG: mevalonate kinase [Candidatus Methanomethylophilus sp.]|nr:mevalonate kinase [Methanomethylophilus sp.]MDD3233398.1 mevalonate kinase [Methanomethylophilus sp.]MDD4221708.1 mevalonate kinase [Methanomethylophilus sp.]MDD4668280.1 mevalonate kinase [Methanomethylophilus sp.]
MIEATASAPSKFVILGEHAVVYGEPSLTLAIDLRFRVRLRYSDAFRVNGQTASNRNTSPHMRYLYDLHGGKPVSAYVESDIPSGSGLGSSAALSVAFAAALQALEGQPLDRAAVAKDAYEAEYYAQGRGSPMDTSTSAAGGGVALNMPHRKEDLLWTISKEDRTWEVSRFDTPPMTFVLGNTGIRAATGPLVDKVRRYRESNSFAAGIVDEIGDVTRDGLRALRAGDLDELGALMTYDHKLLSILGVSCPELNSLVDAALPYSYGAKLTGSGGGGCMVALTDRPQQVAKAILAHGGTPYIVHTGVPGVTVSTREAGQKQRHRGRGHHGEKKNADNRR